MIVVAHRGFSGMAPENTLESFRRAIDVGADMFECDVRRAADGLVVIHDEHLDRTTSGQGAVREHDVQMLRSLGVPSLAEVLDVARGAIQIAIELKEYGLAEDVVRAVSDSKIDADDVIIFGWTMPALEAVATAGFGGRRCLLMEPAPAQAELRRGIFDAAAQLGLTHVGPQDVRLDAGLFDAAHGAGLGALVWTVNDPARMRDLIALGADGLISDYPDRVRAVLRGES